MGVYRDIIRLSIFVTSKTISVMGDGHKFHCIAAELGRNPVSKHQIQPEYGDEQADAGRDG